MAMIWPVSWFITTTDRGAFVVHLGSRGRAPSAGSSVRLPDDRVGRRERPLPCAAGSEQRSAYCWTSRSIDSWMSIPLIGSVRLISRTMLPCGRPRRPSRPTCRAGCLVLHSTPLRRRRPRRGSTCRSRAPRTGPGPRRCRAHVADDVGGERGEGVTAAVRLHHRHAGEVSLRSPRAMTTSPGCPRRSASARVEKSPGEAPLHLLDQDATQPDSRLNRAARSAAGHRRPVDGDVDRLVAGDQPAVVVEDLARSGRSAPCAWSLVDVLLQRARLDGLQEPQPGAEAGE